MTKTEQLLDHMQRKGVARVRDLAALGIPSVYVLRLVRRGQLERVARGLYQLPGTPPTAHHTISMVAARFPRGVICLLSALRLHDLTTQAPADVWLAIDRKARKPVETDLPVRLFRWSKPLLTAGCDTQRLQGVKVRVTNPARTVADCFKYRNKIGLDVALEALRDALRRRACTVDELWYFAGVCRMQNVMRPYLESLA